MVVHVIVVVLGDLGRSPRMQYHGLSLASMETVDVVSMVGYEGENIISDLSHHKKVQEIRMKPVNIDHIRKYSSILHAIVKGVLLMVNLYSVLRDLGSYDIILIQNPPCIPVLFMAFILNVFYGNYGKSKIILDWHNLGYTMFASWNPPVNMLATETINELPIEPKKQSLLVKFARFLEINMCRRICDKHICVSKAMKRHLDVNCGISGAEVVYDRPLRLNAKTNITTEIRHDLFVRLGLIDKDSESTSQTIQTRCTKNESGECKYEMRQDKSFIIITSTSWTPDEDFDLFLESILQLEKHISFINEKKNEKNHVYTVTVLITGKGPLRSAFESQISVLKENQKLRYVNVHCMWLSSSDYFLLLSCADVGVCLHTSTSGLDLPMKVLDMIGAGIVVIAARYYAINELIRHNENGLLFHGSIELTNTVLGLMNIHSKNTSEQNELRIIQQNAQNEHMKVWQENWDTCMKPIVDNMILSSSSKSWGAGYYYLFLLTTLSSLLLLMAYLADHIEKNQHIKSYD